MPKVDFGARRKEAEKEGLVGGGDYLKIKDGANRIRLVSDALPHPGEYKGRPTFKWLCYILDRADGRVKPYFMPHTIYKMLESLQEDPEYAFEDVPMPYDITINAKAAGTKDVEYSVVPARKSTPLTAAEEALVESLKSLEELQDALRAKNDSQREERPFDPDEIPV